MGLLETQIYNADESGLFLRWIPDKTFVGAYEKSVQGFKIQKESVSHKLKPLLIGKAKKPRCFRGFDNPLHYDFSKNA